MSIDFQCKAYGKWILVGEHSVLRGVPALVFPLQSRYLELQYSLAESGPLQLRLQGDHGSDLQMLIWSVLDRACQLKSIQRSDLKGSLYLESSIPVGAGMGASAALCVALTRWLGFLGFVAESEYYEFARQLENLFHGESSGVDIAVALSGEGLHFVRDGERRPLKMAWSPRWYISYSGQKGVTKEAVNKVKDFIRHHPDQGQFLDRQMAEAVKVAEKALSENSSSSFENLARAIEQAGACFQSWGLNEGPPSQHIQWLREQGAVAVKPTGSGGGGYVLSLWSKAPPDSIQNMLIPS
ncbi:MAG: hypothetical protein AAGB31_06520 [Bdellovibrio sp.]